MKHRRWFVILCCLAWAGSIFATSSTVVTPHVFFAWFHENIFEDKAAFSEFQLFWGASWFIVVKGWHVLEFAVLMSLCTWAIDVSTGYRDIRNVMMAAVFCLIYAATDEWHQTFVPERGGIISDVFIDAAGVVLVGVYLCRGRSQSARL